MAVPDVNMKQYSVIDNYSGNNTYYRLKIVNQDRSVKYSRVIMLKGGLQNEEINIRQNPVNTKLEFTFAASSEQKNTVSIYALSGAIVYQKNIQSANGTNSVSVDVQNIPAGMYVVMVTNASGRKATKFVKK